MADACQAVRRCLGERSTRVYLRPLLSSHVLLGDWEAAMALVKQARLLSCRCRARCASHRGS